MSADLLSRFPKTRTALPPAHVRIYQKHYQSNREGIGTANGIAVRLERWMHRRVAKVACYGSLLEIGAGTLNHLFFEQPFPVAYDVVEPFAALYTGRPETARVRRFFADINEIPQENRYAKVASVAVLEHLTELPSVVARACLLLEDDGVFAAGIPSEGGLLWYCAWRFGTGLSYLLRYRLDYGKLIRHEHVNTADEIADVVRYFFHSVATTRFPTKLRHLSLYTFIDARKPDKAAGRAYLNRVAREKSM